jgi:hypothetical protein
MSKVTCPHCLHHFEPTTPRSAAEAAGETFYTPAKPCKVCGTSLRYTCSGNCVKCHNARIRARSEEVKSRLSRSLED